MDPRIKLTWISCEELQKEIISKIVDLIMAESAQSTLKKEEIQENELPTSMSINQDKAGISAKRPRLFAYMPPSRQLMANPSTNHTTAVKTELETYREGSVLPFAVNPLKYWRDTQSFKILKQFAKSILGCCATSALLRECSAKLAIFTLLIEQN